jgi:hypothetical protein
MIVGEKILITHDPMKYWRLHPPTGNYGDNYIHFLGRNLVGAVLLAPIIICFPVPPGPPRKFPRNLVKLIKYVFI